MFLALAASAVAQKVIIASPKENAKATAGGTLLVDISRPVRSPSSHSVSPTSIQAISHLLLLQASDTPSTDVAVIIGLQSCGADGNCDAVAANYARVLYHGPFTPKHIEGHSDVSHNYTVRIPQNTAAGKALLQVAHFFYAGVREAVLCMRDAVVILKRASEGCPPTPDGDSPYGHPDHALRILLMGKGVIATGRF